MSYFKFHVEQFIHIKNFQDELKEYERRLLKLRHFNVDLAAGNEHDNIEKKIKKESRNVQKLHKILEDKIQKRREELQTCTVVISEQNYIFNYLYLFFFI